MAGQWVDITTIDNSTPFIKVRWKASITYGRDAWFAEASGLTTDSMSWTDGNSAALGFFGGHRMNTNSYTCGFNCEEWGIDVGLTPDIYRTHIKDGGRSVYYDQVVQIDNQTYYEVDFSLWDYATGKSLYMPYSNPSAKWGVGDIYVYVEDKAIVLDKESSSIKYSGGTDTVNVSADDDWTAVSSENWLSVSPLSGASGTSAVTISAPSYSGSVNRTATVTFTCSGETAVLNVTQRKEPSGIVGNVYLGALSAEDVRLGSKAVEACYLGDKLVYPVSPTSNIIYTAPAKIVPSVAYSDSGWTLTLDSDTYDAGSGAVKFAGKGLTIPAYAYTGTSFTEMNIGKGVVSIGDSAFASCNDLVSITIPNTVTSIGAGAFFACYSLTAVTIPNSVTSFGDTMFWNCQSLQTAVLPSGITSIPHTTFRGCTALTSVDIPAGVTAIGSSAFWDTTSLTALTIPSGVTEIGNYAFRDSGIVELTFNGDTPPATVGSSPFSGVAATGVIYCPAAAVSAYTTWAQAYGLSGWTVESKGLPDVPFLVNYNAKEFVLTGTTAGYIPNHPDATGFNYDLALDPGSVSSDHITVNQGRPTHMAVDLDASTNPFNGSSNNPVLTIIVKVGPWTSNTDNHIVANRGSNYNWMFRQKPNNGFMLHSQQGTYDLTPGVSGLTTYPNVVICRVNANSQGTVESYTDSQTGLTVTTNYGNASNKIDFLGGGYGSEYFYGDFYWMYISREALTDAEVLQVINYNEEL